MVKYTEKFFSKKFYDEKSKEAYLKACKWLAKYVLSNDEFQTVQFDIVKSKAKSKDGEFIFILELYAVLDETELRERNCKVCKESHSSFFISEETNCSWCKACAYQRRTDQMISSKVGYYKERLSKFLED